MAISIEIDDIKDHADSFKDEAEEQTELIQRCDSLLLEMEDSWQGEAARAFQDQWLELKPKLENASELLETIGDQLEDVAETMERTDEELANSIGI